MSKSFDSQVVGKRRNVYKRLMDSQERVFAFDDPVEFLNYELRERQKKNPRFSLRAWARQVGYANPSYLSHVLKKERKLKMELASKLANNLSLEGKSRRYFELLVMGSATGNEHEKKMYTDLLRGLRPKKVPQINDLSLELFSLISDWYHLAIVEMTQLNDFQGTEAFIQKRLGGQLDKRTIRDAVDRLVRLGLIQRDESGNLSRASENDNVIDLDVSSEAIREHHRQWLEMAKQALQQQTKDERDFCSTTFSFSLKNMEKVREILREAHRKIRDLNESTEGEELYQLNTNFFRVTKPVKRDRKDLQ